MTTVFTDQAAALHFVIARDRNVLRVDFHRDPDPPAPRFPGAGALRGLPPAEAVEAFSSGIHQEGRMIKTMLALLLIAGIVAAAHLNEVYAQGTKRQNAART